ncbi:hypothetical protein ACWGI8_06940 [Streptomyces sp. NPDC054841]
MLRWKNVAAVVAASAVIAGCGSGSGESGGGGKKADGGPGALGEAAKPSAEKAEKLGADPGIRYTKVVLPTMEGLVCDEGDGSFRFGSDLDMRVSADDDMKEIEEADDSADKISCFGSPRIVLRMGTRSAAAPDFTARTKLYEKISDPAAALDKVFTDSLRLSESYGRNLVGEPYTSTSRTVAVKCRKNVADTFPMTTCFWANYGAIGELDFFPAGGQAHVPVESAAVLTKDFVRTALKGTGGS